MRVPVIRWRQTKIGGVRANTDREGQGYSMGSARPETRTCIWLTLTCRLKYILLQLKAAVVAGASGRKSPQHVKYNLF